MIENKMKLRNTVVWCCMIIIIMFCGAFFPAMTYISLILSALCALFIAKIFVRTRTIGVAEGMILILAFQNFAIGVGAHMVGNSDDSLKYLTQIPFLVIAIIFVILKINLYKNKKALHMNKPEKAFQILLLCILLSAIIGRGSVQSMLVNIRNLTVFFMAFEIGRYSIRSEEDLHELEYFVLKISLFLLFCGIIILVAGYPLYKAIGIKEVYIAKGAPIIQEGLDDRFHTTLYKTQYTRMGSLFYEPINLAYFYAMTFLVAWFGKWSFHLQKKVFYILFTGLGLLLTFGKGGYMIVAAVFLCTYGQKVYKFLLRQFSKKIIKRLTIGTIILLLVAFSVWYYLYIGAAVKPHFEGIIRTWASVLKKPLGYGLGTGGNAAMTFGAKIDWLGSGGETALMSFMYQLGIQGIVAFSICIILTCVNFKNNNPEMMMYCYLPFILLGISLLQDNTFTPQCIVLFMLFQGGAKNLTDNKK